MRKNILNSDVIFIDEKKNGMARKLINKNNIINVQSYANNFLKALMEKIQFQRKNQNRFGLNGVCGLILKISKGLRNET